jgi:uncharacterized protein YbaP (TraB family)
MLKMFARALTALAFLLTPAAYAQTVKDADPAIWVVKDKDTTIYLFGTFHALKPGLSWFDEAVKDAFDKSDEVMLEIVPPDTAAALRTFALAARPDGPTVTELLPQDKRASYAAAMNAIGVPMRLFENVDPWLPGAMLTSLSLPKYGFDPNLGAEHVLTDAAKAAGKPVGGLETIEQQFGYLDGMSQDAQLAMLQSTVEETDEAGEMFAEMVADWSAGDDKGLAALMNEGFEESPELRRVMLTERNARWADWIDARMDTPGTVFLAVGAGHLAGPDSVQADLDRHGITVTRVTY